MVNDNSVVAASNVEVCVALGRVKVNAFRIVGDISHDFRLNGIGFEPCKHLTTTSTGVALGKVLVTEGRVTHYDVDKYSLRAVQGFTHDVRPTPLVQVSMELCATHSSSNE